MKKMIIMGNGPFKFSPEEIEALSSEYDVVPIDELDKEISERIKEYNTILNKKKHSKDQ